MKVKPITNKTENQSKDALDRSENYAKIKTVLNAKVCQVQNYAKSKIAQSTKYALCYSIYPVMLLGKPVISVIDDFFRRKKNLRGEGGSFLVFFFF